VRFVVGSQSCGIDPNDRSDPLGCEPMPIMQPGALQQRNMCVWGCTCQPATPAVGWNLAVVGQDVQAYALLPAPSPWPVGDMVMEGSVGMDFDVQQWVLVLRLGAFDHLSDGFRLEPPCSFGVALPVHPSHRCCWTGLPPFEWRCTTVTRGKK
jgi:hypothetical protein